MYDVVRNSWVPVDGGRLRVGELNSSCYIFNPSPCAIQPPGGRLSHPGPVSGYNNKMHKALNVLLENSKKNYGDSTPPPGGL